MTRRSLLTTTLALGAPALIRRVQAQEPPRKTPEPTTAYNLRAMEGWNIRVNKRFAESNRTLCGDCLVLLRSHLYRIKRVVPGEAVPALQRITIWVEENEGHHPCMAYHPDAGWLTEHDMNPDKARCVEIANATNFLDWEHQQPWMILHELAHGYHHQFLKDGFDNAEVKSAYDKAVAAKSYESILRIGGTHERHYALTNPQEYFAELSESYFGTNDFYPFVRAELREHDPQGYAMIEKMWGVRK